MFRLTYKDSYQVERVQEYEDYEALMLSLSGCVTLPDTTLITSLTHNGVEIYQGQRLVGRVERPDDRRRPPATAWPNALLP